MRQKKLSAILILTAMWLPQLTSAAASSAELEWFENKVRPLLVTRCVSCHGADKRAAGLRLDSREAILRGGEKGAAVTLRGEPAASRLIQTVSGKLPAPAPCRLKSAEVAVFTQWIASGLPWPKNTQSIDSAEKNHWAFQPVLQAKAPHPNNANWVSTPIDAFVLEKLEQANLIPSPEADRRSLIRRVFYTLTGLPPSYEELHSFVHDTDPQAYEKLVERLLDSEHYGEHWARHWLDVARYSDTKGYVFAREERFWTHAWSYRDWVADALNQDLPYDRFLLMQIAADQAKGAKKTDLAAMGFLTLGRRFLGVTHDIIDDRIDVVTRGTMGLTVACARCHDHMYDPIPTQDYYSLYSIFASSAEKQVALDRPSNDDAEFWKELHKRQQALQKKTEESHQQSSDRARKRIADYLHAQTELDKYPAEGFDQIFSKDDLLPSFVRRWDSYLKQADQQKDPIFIPWHAFIKLPEASFEEEAKKITLKLNSGALGKINPLVAQTFTKAPTSFKEVIARYKALFLKTDETWKSQSKKAALAKIKPPSKLDSPAAEALRLVLYGRTSPCEVPNQPIIHTETYFDSSTTTALWKLQGEVDRWIVKAKTPAHFALALTDRPVAVTSRVLLRGNSLNQGEEAPRRFLSLIAGEKRQNFQQGSGRLELAKAIIDPSNPLTARVMVNRVWAHHFGSGLVSTPSDFGTRADLPSHPDLLDWLAQRFMSEGWSLKKLHRWMVLSSTFRQSSKGSHKPAILTHALNLDPSNRLLWQMNAHRLSYEEFRDSMMAASSQLDRRLGGKPTDFFKKPFPKRRALYGLVDRQFVPTTLRMFDFANPDLHIAKRIETTVPQQALFFMNHPLILERSQALASLTNKQTDAEDKIRVLFRQSLQRNPTNLEIAESLALVAAVKEKPQAEAPPTSADWQYGYGKFDEKTQRITGFTRLPHFTGQAWQGGQMWPDSKLGWLQLTATGGHPGNDTQHAAIRRWTAPHSMTVEIQSILKHEPSAGDGIRAFVIHSRVGKLLYTKIHHHSEPLNLKPIAVEKGETIDFVVDIDKVLNSDQYLWQVTLSESDRGENAITWNSKTDFPHQTPRHLTAWEQLAQTLLSSNEFLFVD